MRDMRRTTRNCQFIMWYSINSNVQNSHVLWILRDHLLLIEHYTFLVIECEKVWVDICTLQDSLHETMSVECRSHLDTNVNRRNLFHVHFGAQVIAVMKTHYKVNKKTVCDTVTCHLMLESGFHWICVALPEDKITLSPALVRKAACGPCKSPQAVGFLSPAVSLRLWKALLSLFFKDLNLSVSLCPAWKTDEHYSHVSAFKSASCLTKLLVPRLLGRNVNPGKCASIKII